jgi:glycosyltransferase involved in cell wall biosynthesis
MYVLFPKEERVRIVWMIPCHNEELTIGMVVKDIRALMPESEVWVCDNRSTDRTAERARASGAFLIEEANLGKGRAVQSLLNSVGRADVYILIDGDSTYDISSARALVVQITDGSADMVIATRKYQSYPLGTLPNRWGGHFFSWLFWPFFGLPVADVLSGFRAFNGKIHDVGIEAKRFELEVDLTARFVTAGLKIAEITAPYFERPVGSVSKLRRVADGFTILRYIFLYGVKWRLQTVSVGR